MREAAANLEFEEAARLRDEIRKLEDKELGVTTVRPSHPPRAAGAAWKPTSGSREDKRRAAQAKARSRRRAGP
jgi:excinuclease ABC subunit B